MLQLTRVACKFVPPTLAVEYLKPGSSQKRVRELGISHLMDHAPEEAIDELEALHPWIFVKTNATRTQFVRVFTIAKRGYWERVRRQREEEEIKNREALSKINTEDVNAAATDNNTDTGAERITGAESNTDTGALTEEAQVGALTDNNKDQPQVPVPTTQLGLALTEDDDVESEQLEDLALPAVVHHDLRASVESRRSRKSSGSRGRYGDYSVRASLNISTTFDHGLLSEMALMGMDDEL